MSALRVSLWSVGSDIHIYICIYVVYMCAFVCGPAGNPSSVSGWTWGHGEAASLPLSGCCLWHDMSSSISINRYVVEKEFFLEHMLAKL